MRERINNETFQAMTLFEVQREMDALEKDILYLKDHGGLSDYEAAKREYVRLARRESYLTELSWQPRGR